MFWFDFENERIATSLSATLMSKQFLSEKETKDVYKKACAEFGDDSPPENFAGFLDAINKNLRAFDMEIRRGVSEDDGNIHFGLVNTAEDEHSKMATDYSPNDITFFKKVMDLIVASPDGTVSSMEALHIAPDLEKKMAITHAEKLIGKLVKDNWMSESSGSYSLGPRAMLELHPYLNRVYEDDVVECMICHMIAIKGQCCEQCEGKIHKRCAARYFQRRTVKTCPNQQCGAVWTNEILELSSSAANEEGESIAVPTSQKRKKRR